MSQVRDLIKHLRNLDPNMHVASMLWAPEDVKQVAYDKGKLISDEQVNELLDDLDRNADAETGISWDSIGSCLDDYDLPDAREDRDGE
jgi:hypothetical protein